MGTPHGHVGHPTWPKQETSTQQQPVGGHRFWTPINNINTALASTGARKRVRTQVERRDWNWEAHYRDGHQDAQDKLTKTRHPGERGWGRRFMNPSNDAKYDDKYEHDQQDVLEPWLVSYGKQWFTKPSVPWGGGNLHTQGQSHNTAPWLRSNTHTTPRASHGGFHD